MTKNNSNTPSQIKVSRSVQDSKGDTYCLIKMNTKECWISVTEMVLSRSSVFSQLADAGIPLVSSSAQTQLINQVQNHPQPTPALVARQPGWIAINVYVHPNGEVKKGDKVTEEIIVAFPPDPAYSTSGTLNEWQVIFEPLLKNQPIIRFGFCYSFASSLIAKVRPIPLNQTLELFGEKEAGKSVLGMAMGSVHGGEPETGIGIGRTADGTSAGFKQIQRSTNDSLLILDETNILDKSVEKNLRLFFDQTSRDERLRFGKTDRTQPIRNALLITGNERLANRTKASSSILKAAQSRCLSIDVGRSILNKTKKTEAESRNYFLDIINASNDCYGTASRAFVEKIIKECKDDAAADAFAMKISNLMERFLADMPSAPHLPNRLKTTIALSYAAGWLAWKWEIWPAKKPLLKRTCRQIYNSASQMALLDNSVNSLAVKRFISAIKSHEKHIELVSQKQSYSKIKTTPKPLGYRLKKEAGLVRYFFNKSNMKIILGENMTSDLKEIRDQGFLKGEGGEHSRLMSKAPKYIPMSGRIYEFIIPSDLLK